MSEQMDGSMDGPMSACEVCWEKAWRTAQFRGTSQVDEYQRLTAKGREYHAPSHTEEDNDE